jgi:hypothetical protein
MIVVSTKTKVWNHIHVNVKENETTERVEVKVNEAGLFGPLTVLGSLYDSWIHAYSMYSTYSMYSMYSTYSMYNKQCKKVQSKDVLPLIYWNLNGILECLRYSMYTC